MRIVQVWDSTLEAILQEKGYPAFSFMVIWTHREMTERDFIVSGKSG